MYDPLLGQKLLHKYLSGDITSSEEKTLFDLAKGDQFLSEALAGYQQFSSQEGNIDSLRSELHSKKDARSRLFWMKIAAGIAVVIFAIWNIPSEFMSTKSDNKEVLISDASSISDYEEEAVVRIQVLDSQSIADIDIAQGGTESIRSQINETDVAANDNVDKKKKIPIPSKPRNDVSPLQENDLNTAETEQSYAKVNEEQKAISDNEETDGVEINEVTVSASRTSKARASLPISEIPIQESQLSLSKNQEPSISGYVTDEYGDPLIGANVIVPGSDVGTITDMDGSFSISPAAPVSELLISYSGYQNKLIKTNEEDSLEITLTGNTDLLEEVVVVGYSKSSENESIFKPFATPANGIRKYKKYVKSNLKYPIEAEKNNIHGKVKVRFLVYADGTIDSIDVVESLGYGCDEEAIRLLNEGPKWKVTTKGASAWKTWVFKF